jgi:hypothetical protein
MKVLIGILVKNYIHYYQHLPPRGEVEVLSKNPQFVEF